ncbi:MAG: hypothetical protein NXI25_27025, partial [bacterium]|nr:hypothetical protein [bacterium]
HASQMSQALLGELVMSQRKQDELEGVGRPGGILLCQGAGTVWSEHSERATLRSWAASLGVDDYVAKQLGRWQPSTDEAYVRSIRGNVEKAQKMMAEEIRNNLGGPDKLDEESIMDKVVEKLAGQEVDANDVEDQKLRLTSFQGGIFASILGKDSWQASEKDPLEIVEVEDGDEASKNEETASEPDRTPEGYKSRYFVSLVGRSQRRTLHRGGECHRVPGVHYKRFEDLGEDLPPEGMYHRVCKECFPRGVEAGDESGATEDSEVSSSISASTESLD